MHPAFRNLIAVVVGALVGGLINMGLIMISGSVIPPPEGADLTTVEGLEAAKDLMQPKHYIFPFLAHALGTLLGALIATIIAGRLKLAMAMIVGGLFLLGGIIAAKTIPAPTWFVILDLGLGYIPMAYFGWKVAAPRRR